MGTVTVLHLAGSPTDEFHADLSRLYARDCLAAVADPDRYVSRLAWVAPDGSWRFPDDLSAAAVAAAPTVDLAGAIAHLQRLAPDVMVPHLFCLAGMTTYRALFDLLGIGYLGNPPAVMAVAADKAQARAIVAAAGVAVPAGEVLRRGQTPTLPPPVVVKPVGADNSVGVSLVRDAADYPAALDLALHHGGAALVETYVELGREVRCGIVVRDGEPVCLPLEEYAVHPVDKPIRDRADKLARGDDGELHLVAKDRDHAWIIDADDAIVAAVNRAARACHDALGARHYSLFDFRIDPAGRPWFLEAGPYCSFAPASVIATMAAAAGVALPDLFAGCVAELRREESSCGTPR